MGQQTNEEAALTWLEVDAVRAQQWRAEHLAHAKASEALANSIKARAAVDELVEAADAIRRHDRAGDLSAADFKRLRLAVAAVRGAK